MKSLYPNNTAIACSHHQTIMTATQGILVPMADGSFGIDQNATRNDIIEGLRQLGALCAYTSCRNNFTAGDYWNQMSKTYGDRMGLLAEAFGFENAKRMYRFFAPKGSIAKACPAPRDYALPWNYYKLKAVSQNKKQAHAVKTLHFQAICIDSEGNKTGLIIEHEGDNLVIRSEDIDDIFVPIPPLQNFIFDNWKQEKNRQKIFRGDLLAEARATYSTDSEADAFAESVA